VPDSLKLSALHDCSAVTAFMKTVASFFEKRHLGDILSRIGSVQPIQDAITRGLIAVLIDGMMAFIAAGVLFFYSTLLAFVVLAGVALELFIAMAYYSATRMRMQEEIIAKAKESTVIMEAVRAAITIKLLGREAEREAKRKEAVRILIRNQTRNHSRILVRVALARREARKIRQPGIMFHAVLLLMGEAVHRDLVLSSAWSAASHQQQAPAEYPICGGRMIVIEVFARGSKPRYQPPVMTPPSYCVAAEPPRWPVAGVSPLRPMPAGTPIETSKTAHSNPITAYPDAILGRAEPLLAAMRPIAGGRSKPPIPIEPAA